MLNRIVALAAQVMPIDDFNSEYIHLRDIPLSVLARLLSVRNGEACRNLRDAPHELKKQCERVKQSLYNQNNDNPLFSTVTFQSTKGVFHSYYTVIWVVQLNNTFYSIFGAKETQADGCELGGSSSVPGSMVSIPG